MSKNFDFDFEVAAFLNRCERVQNVYMTAMLFLFIPVFVSLISSGLSVAGTLILIVSVPMLFVVTLAFVPSVVIGLVFSARNPNSAVLAESISVSEFEFGRFDFYGAINQINQRNRTKTLTR